MMLRVAKALLTLSLFVCCGSLKAQNLSGIWRGYFVSESYDQYKLEVQIKQTPQRSVSGVTYSYLTTVFYGKATATGTYDPAKKQIIIQEIKTVELRMSGGSVSCIMKYLLEYARSGNEEFLEGTYTSKYEKSIKESGIGRGEGCGGGKVYLRKVTTSDFYVEPFLRDNPATQTRPNIAQNKPKPPAAKPTQQQPQAKTPQVSKQPPVVSTKPKVDTVRQAPAPPIVRQEAPRSATPPPPRFTPPATTRNRTNDLVQTLTIQEEEIVVKIYDNGEIDDDTISVYFDDKIVLSQKRLTAAPLTINLKMNPAHPEHVLVLVAENLGRIPPNTSLMIVQDGDRRYQVRITSTTQKNAMVRFRYEGKGD